MASDDLEQILHESIKSAHESSADLDQVKKRGRILRRRRRLSGALVGVSAIALAATAAIAWPRFEPGDQLQPASRPTTGLPEGQLLIQVGNRVEIVDSDGERETIASRVEAYDLTQAGTQITGVTEEVDNATGRVVTRSELLLIDETWRQRRVVARSGSAAAFGPALASPDGTQIAYRLSVWNPDDSRGAQPARELLCVVEVATKDGDCFRDLPDVLSFDWSPDSRSLLASGAGTVPVYVVDVKSGDARPLLPVHGTPSVRAAIKDAGYGAAQQFVNPVWSPSGKYVATSVMIAQGGLSVPLVVDQAGEFVALGQANIDFQRLAWSPVRDGLLAYTMGYNGIGPDDYPFGVRLLDAITGEDRWLLSTADEVQPVVFQLRWSPSGRWLALDHSTTIRIVDVSAGTTALIDLALARGGDTVETLRDWAP